MAAPASERGPLETLALAGIGALALAAGRADDLVEDLARRLGVDVDDVREALADGLESWQREARRLREQPGASLARMASELGLASREALDELELRVARLEHRLKLLERQAGAE
jgi:polyhydroxyalkanoate synthesis regulator phasin